MTCQVGSCILGHWRGKKSRGCKFVSCQWIANYLSSKIDWKPENQKGNENRKERFNDWAQSTPAVGAWLAKEKPAKGIEKEYPLGKLYPRSE